VEGLSLHLAEGQARGRCRTLFRRWQISGLNKAGRNSWNCQLLLQGCKVFAGVEGEVVSAFTLFHVVLSLVGIGSGFVVVFGLFLGKGLPVWTATFLPTTVLTSVTGFLFPVHHFMPSHGVGIVSLIVLALAIYALYVNRLAGGWRRFYVIDAVIALDLNFFVLIGQLFEKVPALKARAPTQTEAPFKVAQLAVFATCRFRSERLRIA
jgi:hypothetical protein